MPLMLSNPLLFTWSMEKYRDKRKEQENDECIAAARG
jgi:hypothetical protein